jgi:hypothetical protein
MSTKKRQRTYERYNLLRRGQDTTRAIEMSLLPCSVVPQPMELANLFQVIIKNTSPQSHEREGPNNLSKNFFLVIRKGYLPTEALIFLLLTILWGRRFIETLGGDIRGLEVVGRNVLLVLVPKGTGDRSGRRGGVTWILCMTLILRTGDRARVSLGVGRGVTFGLGGN